jgi:hypothetical protein
LALHEEIVVVHHTDCSTMHFTNDQFRAGLKAYHPGRANKVDAMEVGGSYNSSSMIGYEVLSLKPMCHKTLCYHLLFRCIDLQIVLLARIRSNGNHKQAIVEDAEVMNSTRYVGE